jgi:hypothetical protein
MIAKPRESIVSGEEAGKIMQEMDSNPEEMKKALVKVSNNINQKRRTELMRLFFQKTEWSNWIAKQRAQGSQRSRSKVWKKVASMPLEIDRFFTKIYGRDYYKDPDFFSKYGPEWRVYD